MSEGMIASYFSDSPPVVEFSTYNFVIFVKFCDFVMFRLSIVILGNILNLQFLRETYGVKVNILFSLCLRNLITLVECLQT